jgi:hypothetical protein
MAPKPRPPSSPFLLARLISSRRASFARSRVALLVALLALHAALLAACAQAPAFGPAPAARPSAPLAPAITAPAPAPALPVTARYDVSVRLLPDARRLEAQVIVSLPPAASAQDKLTFSLRADMDGVSAEVLEPAASAGPASLRAGDKDPDRQASRRWELTPTQPFAAGAAAKIRVTYAGGSTVGLNFYLGPEASFAGGGTTAWYPQFGDLRATGVMRVTVPRGTSVRATGVLLRERDDGAERVFEIDAKWPAHLGFAAGPYRVYRHDSGGVPVTLYLLRDRPYAEALVRVCRDTLRVLENEFGPYPFEEFAVMEAPTEPAQKSGFIGAAYEGFMLVRSDFLDEKEADVAHFGHEIGHQWWGLLVQKTGDKGEFMLDEALAQYGALRTVEELDGPLAAERFRRGIDGLGGARDAARLMAAGFDHPLGELPLTNAAYKLSDSKGYLVYSLLARTAGRDAFRSALARVTRRYAFSSITWEQLLAEVQGSTSVDLRGFYAEWFARPGAPVLASAWKQEGGVVKVTVEQTGPIFRLTIPVQIELDDGAVIRTHVDLLGARTEVSVPAPRPVYAVRLDPRFEVLHFTPRDKAEAEALADVTRAKLVRKQGKNAEAQDLLVAGLARLPEVDAFGVELALRLELASLHKDEKRLDDAARELALALALPVRPDDLLALLYLRVAEVADLRGDRKRRDWAARKVIDAEASLGASSRSREARALLSRESRP